MGEKKLGLGLESFFSVTTPPSAIPPPGTGEDRRLLEKPVEIPVSSIHSNPNQPRKEFRVENLEELKKSIIEKGILQPVLVRPMGKSYEIVAGERRWRAAQAAGLSAIPAIVKQLDDREALEISLIENIQRQDLNPIERATAFQQLINRFALTQEDMARRVGQDRSTVANFIRLLDLAPNVQSYVSRGTLSMGHARAILSVENHADQERIANHTIKKQLSVRAVENLVRFVSAPTKHPGDGRKAPAYLKDLESKLSKRFGTKVAIKEGRKRGSGSINIAFYNLDDFDRICDIAGLSTES